MSLSNLTWCLCTLANATTLVNAPTIKTTSTRFMNDFITALLAFISSVSLSSSATKHRSQICYDNNRTRFKFRVREYQRVFKKSDVICWIRVERRPSTPLRTRPNSERFRVLQSLPSLYKSLQFLTDF